MKPDENLRKLLFKFMESEALLNFQVESLIQLRKTAIDEVCEAF